MDKEKDKDEKYSPKNCKLRRLSKPPFQTNSSPEMVSKLDLTDAKNSDTAHIKSIEITSILNGLQGKYNRRLLSCANVLVCVSQILQGYFSDIIKFCFLMEPELFLAPLLLEINQPLIGNISLISRSKGTITF